VTPTWIEAAIGGAAGLTLSAALIRWVGPLGWMDRPDDSRKKHARPTPRTAGMVLWLMLIAAQLTGRMPFHLDPSDWVCLHLMAFIGLLDDRFNLRARYKAMAGLVVAVMLAFHVALSLGRAVEYVSFLGLSLPSHPVVLIPVLMLWFWALPQAYNLIDGINGLSMGYAALLLGVLGWNLGGQPVLLWGGLAAVLALNFPKARHFMGDCGALLMGTFFAILGMEAFALRDPDLLLWVFAYPIVDVCLVVGIRYWKDRPLAEADRSHLHHWMMDRMRGRSWFATPILLTIAALPMLRATALPGHETVSLMGLGVLLALALKAFKDRVTSRGLKEATAQVRREIPIMVSGSVRAVSGGYRAVSGPHPKF
jgi:UDP-GlcNAc:undecaprenyl-phosphate GlcNAc-1-phosphate transferase